MGKIAVDGETAKQLGVVFRALHFGQTRPLNIKEFKMAIGILMVMASMIHTNSL